MLAALCLTASAALRAQTEERTLSADSIVSLDGRLDSLYRTLPEVMITGERPVVKAEGGKLVYDLPRMLADRPADNLYEALKHLPGVVEQEGRLTLSGQSVRVVLDGKVTTLSTEQLYALLKSMPADRIEQAEVMYNAPARYQVRGALINISLKHSDKEKPTLQGEAYAHYEQQHEAAFVQRAALLYSHRRFSTDLLYRHGHGRSYSTTGKEARHTLSDGTLHTLCTDEQGRGSYYSHNFRLGMDYAFAKDHTLSLAYNGIHEASDSDIRTQGFLHSDVTRTADKWLHNLRLDYVTPIGLTAGAEMTYYRTPSTQWLESEMQGSATRFRSDELQRINRWKYFLAGEHTLAGGWGVNYGALLQTGIDHSSQHYSQGTDLPASMSSRRREETLNLYAGFSKSVGKRLSLDFSLAAERYHSPAWNEWDFYPTFNLSFRPADAHILQLAFGGSKEYPDYWAVQDAVSYISSYSEVQGNPLLKPYTLYNASLTYTLQGRYVFRLWMDHMDDFAVQTLYQSPDRLAEIYRYVNFDYWQQSGLMASLPLKIKKVMSGRLNAMAIFIRQKDSDFYDLPFSRHRLLPMLTLNTTWTLASRPDLKLQVDGRLQGRAIQGIYDLPASGTLNLALRLGLLHGQASLKLYANDLFRTAGISPYIRYATQWVTNNYSCYRTLGLSLTYKLGGYKEKQREAVDASRFK